MTADTRDSDRLVVGARFLRPVYAVAIALAGGLALLHLISLLAGLAGATWLLALVGLVLGVLAADVASGVVHWASDTWGDERTPWLGESIIRAFREHHLEPRAMLGHDWIEVNGETAAPSALVLLGMTLPAWHTALEARPGLHAFLWSLAAFGALSNLFHCWAHAPEAPGWVRRLQGLGLILSPARHARHHRAPHTSAYCISTGWSNACLDAVGFWRGLERCVTALTGAQPRGDLDSDAHAGGRPL